MSSKIKVILLYCAVTVLSLGLCWSIYLSVHKIDDTFTTLSDEDLKTLGHLSSFRANLVEHERQLFEYYADRATRTQALVNLALVRHTLEADLAYLQKTVGSETNYPTLTQTYAGFSEELHQLDGILQKSPVDWDAARASLTRLSEHGREAAPAIKTLFQLVESKGEQTKIQVKKQLKQITNLVVGFVIVVLAITFVIGYATRERLRADNERRRLAYFPERNPNPVFSLTLEGDVIYANPSCHRIAARLDEKLPSILSPDIKQRIQTLRVLNEYWQQYEYKLCDHIFSAKLQLLPDLDVCHVYINDVTDQRTAQEKLQFLAYHDPVTGLPNRHSFLNDCTTWVDEQDISFSLLMISFIRFELVSRSLGIDVVDELLKLLGQRLNTALAATGNEIHTARLYRLSGATFAVLVRAQHENKLRAITEQAANLLLVEAAQPFQVHRREFWLHPAIGASFCPEDAIIPKDIIGTARASMASLVTQHRSGYQTLTTKIMLAEDRWLATEAALRHGLENGEFCLYYQPKVAAIDGRLCGFEALLRWDRSASGSVSPAEFIPVAEESGLILTLGTWVLEEACRQAAAWVNSGRNRFTVAVNVSMLQFQQTEFVKHVEQILARYELDPQYLELEITESLLMQNLDSNIATLHALRQLGVGLAIDDFGTGYSSLEYLLGFPVTQLKIDRTFIIHIAEDPRQRAIVQAMIDLAHNLNLKIVAEGVETKEQSAILVRLGCDEIQGYYYCRPLDQDAINTWWADCQKNNFLHPSTAVG